MKIIEFNDDKKMESVLCVRMRRSDIMETKFTEVELECLKAAGRRGRISDKIFAMYVIAKRMEIEQDKRNALGSGECTGCKGKSSTGKP